MFLDCNMLKYAGAFVQLWVEMIDIWADGSYDFFWEQKW